MLTGGLCFLVIWSRICYVNFLSIGLFSMFGLQPLLTKTGWGCTIGRYLHIHSHRQSEVEYFTFWWQKPFGVSFTIMPCCSLISPVQVDSFTFSLFVTAFQITTLESNLIYVFFYTSTLCYFSIVLVSAVP